MKIEHRIEIAAPVERVWELTTDVEGWPSLMPTITSVERLDDGPIRVGSTARIKQPGQRAKVWTVSTVEPGRRFVWGSHAFGVDMVATHTLESTGTATANTLTLDLEGKRAGLVGTLLGRQLRKVLETENSCFKAHAERP